MKKLHILTLIALLAAVAALVAATAACEEVIDKPDKPTPVNPTPVNPTPVDPTPAVIPVTSVTLNQTSIQLKVGGNYTLTATVAPSDATDKTVAWKSSDTQVATVDASGKIKAEAPGKTVITATSGNYSAQCEVSVILSGGNEDFGYDKLK